jgi:hypothetical protein
MLIKREPLNVPGLLYISVAGSLLVWCVSVAIGDDHPIYKASGIYAEKPEPKQQISPVLPAVEKPPVAEVNMDFLSCDPWYEVDQRTGQKYNVSVDHLFKDHKDEIKKLGITREFASGLTVDQRNRLHGKLHGELPQASRSTATITTTTILPIVKAPATPHVAPSGYVRGNCPGGFCPAPQPSVYRRGRR